MPQALSTFCSQDMPQKGPQNVQLVLPEKSRTTAPWQMRRKRSEQSWFVSVLGWLDLKSVEVWQRIARHVLFSEVFAGEYLRVPNLLQQQNKSPLKGVSMLDSS